MELRTAKVRPMGGESSRETIQKLCTQFALLIDEVGYMLSVSDSDKQKLLKQVESLSKTVKELEERVSNITT